MPIIRRGISKSANPLKQSFFEKIDRGKVVPLVNSDAINRLVFGDPHKLIASYADYIQYPLEDRHNLFNMVRYKLIMEDLDSWALKSDYLNFIKNALYYLAKDNGLDEDHLEEAAEQVDDFTVSEFAHQLDYPHFEDELRHPLVILANLPLPIYMTTSPLDFLQVALKKAGKNPHTEICRWHSGLETIPSVFEVDYEPTIQEPLVYHLHGFDEYPDSLVLSEDDYLEFLVNISRDKGQGIDLIPRRIRQAISDSALMLLGYDDIDFPFRILNWGLFQSAAISHQGICAIKSNWEAERVNLERKYLKRFINLQLELQDIQEYTAQLQARLMG